MCCRRLPTQVVHSARRQQASRRLGIAAGGSRQYAAAAAQGRGELLRMGAQVGGRRACTCTLTYWCGSLRGLHTQWGTSQDHRVAKSAMKSTRVVMRNSA